LTVEADAKPREAQEGRLPHAGTAAKAAEPPGINRKQDAEDAAKSAVPQNKYFFGEKKTADLRGAAAREKKRKNWSATTICGKFRLSRRWSRRKRRNC